MGEEVEVFLVEGVRVFWGIISILVRGERRGRRGRFGVFRCGVWFLF